MFDSILQSLFSTFMSVAIFISGLLMPGMTSGSVPDGAKHINYGESESQYFDLYLPINSGEATPVVVMIHGGAWMMGDASMFSTYCRTLASDYGYIAASVDYSKITDGATCLDMVGDIADAVACVKEAAVDKGYTVDKMAVIGHSAGAQLALMYAYTEYVDCPLTLSFIMSVSAPSDILDKGDTKTTVGSLRYLVVSALTGVAVTPWNMDDHADALDTVLAVNHVDANVPPTIVIQGDADELVPYQNSVKLYTLLQNAGVDSVFVTIPGGGHFISQTEGAIDLCENAFAEFCEKYF